MLHLNVKGRVEGIITRLALIPSHCWCSPGCITMLTHVQLFCPLGSLCPPLWTTHSRSSPSLFTYLAHVHIHQHVDPQVLSPFLRNGSDISLFSVTVDFTWQTWFFEYDGVCIGNHIRHFLQNPEKHTIWPDLVTFNPIMHLELAPCLQWIGFSSPNPCPEVYKRHGKPDYQWKLRQKLASTFSMVVVASSTFSFVREGVLCLAFLFWLIYL